MSVQDKFDAVSVLVQEHNEAIGDPDQPGYVEVNPFLSCLKAAGGTTEDRLRELSYEDILQCLPTFDAGGVKVQPKALAKQIAKIFREKEESTKEENAPRNVSSKKARNMTHFELVQAFDPEMPDSPVGKRLSEISKGQPFLVYSEGRTIAVEVSVKLLRELRDFGPRENYELDGDIKEIYAVGELPDNYADENPLYPNRPLRPDGMCDQLNRSYAGIPLEVRQMMRLVLECEGVTISGADGRDRAHNLLDLALESGAFKKLRSRYRKAATAYDRAKKEGKLPSLRIVLGKPVEAKDGGNPFEGGQRVVWIPHAAPQTPKQIEPNHLIHKSNMWNYYSSHNPDYYSAKWVK